MAPADCSLPCGADCQPDVSVDAEAGAKAQHAAQQAPAAKQQEQQRQQHQQQQQKQQQPRLFYIDWLRALVIFLVVVFHCIDLYFDYTSSAGVYLGIVNAPPSDASRTVAIVVAQLMQSWFMGLMFLAAGYFTPPSYGRKGPVRFLWDRVLRLVVPLLVYDALLQPLAFEVARLSPAAYGPLRGAPPGAGFTWYFSSYTRLGHGAAWFLAVLFLFDVAYVAARMCASAAAACCGARRRVAPAPAPDACCDVECGLKEAAPGGERCAGAPAGRQQQQQPACAANAFSCASTAVGAIQAAAVIGGLTLLVRVGILIPLGLQVSLWTLTVVQLQPAYLPQYAVAFALGLMAHRSDALRRLPARAGPAAAVAAALLAAGGGALMALCPGSNFGAELQRGPSAGYVAAFAVWEALYCVAMWLALLVCFRSGANHRGGRAGAALTGAAFGVYVLHVVAVSAFGVALAPLAWHPAAKCALVVPAVVVSSWAASMLLRLIPGVKRVL